MSHFLSKREVNGNTSGHFPKIANHGKLWEHEQIQANGRPWF
jgi:hypothetical protein